ncbi:unnamed protein product [Dovyalis caffra]|uniref:Pentatricopeptide repeat-containing protein n=1 Tax=Dovyalis caffra TaxID=77055 RepID=A0AAV1QVQ9_9ROSI|nr:unnamed protein product [Dovyalis caffra]
MQKSEHAVPDKYTYQPLLKACSNELKLKEGEIVYGSAIWCVVSDDMHVDSRLIDFYGKCKELLSARNVFDEISDRNVVSWTAMIVGYANVRDLKNAKSVFERMPERNLRSWNAMIGGPIHVGDLSGARKVFYEMVERNVVSFTVMIDRYAKAGDMAFEEVSEKDMQGLCLRKFHGRQFGLS